MTPEEFENLLSAVLALGHELQHVEVKSGGENKGHLRAKVLRAILGMANRRDGGYVLIGISDTNSTLNITGLSPEHERQWTHDAIAAKLGEYADPSIRFDRQAFEADGKTIIALRVHEFDRIPILCKKEYSIDNSLVLKRGACYVRPKRKHETSEIATYEEMRDLISLAVEKELEYVQGLVHRSGAILIPPSNIYDEELSNVIDSDTTSRIRSRGYWEFRITPTEFVDERIAAYGDLERIMARSSVQVGGWQYPYVSRGESTHLLRFPHAFGQEIEWDWHLESWRLFQSGQFFYTFAIWTDWWDQNERFVPRVRPENWKPGGLLAVADTVMIISALFRLAARIVGASGVEDSVKVSIGLHSIEGRELWQPDPSRFLVPYTHMGHRFSTRSFVQEDVYNRTELSAHYMGLASKVAHELFLRSGWDPGIETIRMIQSEIGQ